MREGGGGDSGYCQRERLLPEGSKMSGDTFMLLRFDFIHRCLCSSRVGVFTLGMTNTCQFVTALLKCSVLILQMGDILRYFFFFNLYYYYSIDGWWVGAE